MKPHRPPRFLLNDIVRYWRTICVDFAGKEWEGPEKWASGTRTQDESARALGAYDEFVGWMNDPNFRQALPGVTRENADRAESFSEVRRVGREVQAGLLALPYEASRELSKVARDYAIF